jgi:type IV pilus assembly protein PilM
VAGSRTVGVVVAAYARETIMQYYDACRSAQLTPICFEVEAQAMARAVIPKDIAGATMMVDFGKTRTGIGVVLDGVLRYTSTIDIGGADLSRMMRKALGERSESELTHIKNTEGLVRRRDSSVVHDTLVPTISIIKDELASRMQYWHLDNKMDASRRITNMVLCGGSANLKGLPEYLSDTLEIPAVRADVWQSVRRNPSDIPPIDKRHSYGYATAVGLALRETV